MHEWECVEECSMCSRAECDLPPAVPEGWTRSGSADVSQLPAPLKAFIYSMFNITQNFLRLFSPLSPSFLSSPLTSPSLPLSSFSSPPLCCPHQRSRSLVLLSLGWHREQADTWEGCFVIQQVIPPWQRERGGGPGWWDARRERRGRKDWVGLYYYLPTYTFAASLCLRADGLSLFSHWQQEVSPCYVFCVRWGFGREQGRGGKTETRKCENERGMIEKRKVGRQGRMNMRMGEGCLEGLNQWSLLAQEMY